MCYIALIDDNVKFQDMFCKMMEKEFNLEVKAFTSHKGEFEKEQSIRLIFMDINLGPFNGIDVAESLYLQNNNLNFIFITNYNNLVVNSQMPNVLDFVSKYHLKNQLIRVLKSKAVHQVLKPYYTCIGTTFYDYNRIQYLESDCHSLNIYIEDKVSNEHGKISSAAVELAAYNFIQIHRCYVVNLHKIVKIRGATILMDNGSVLPIGRKFSPSTMDCCKKLTLK